MYPPFSYVTLNNHGLKTISCSLKSFSDSRVLPRVVVAVDNAVVVEVDDVVVAVVVDTVDPSVARSCDEELLKH